MKYIFKLHLSILLLLFHANIHGDSFQYNTYNNHGVVGLINMPTARFYNEASHGITIYDGTPDQKITLTSSPYDWLEASFFYTNIQDKPYGNGIDQDYKDKGFNFKLKLSDQGVFPAIAIGINDIAGTGLYSSEYIVGSYGVNRTDFHFGIGWGALDGADSTFENPLIKIYDGFSKRSGNASGNDKMGGQFSPGRYFSGKTASPFFGLSYAVNENALLKFEYDSTLTPGQIGYEIPKDSFSYGFEFTIRNNFTIGLSRERGNFTSIKFTYKNNPNTTYKKYEYKNENKVTDNKYKNLITNLERNGIGVNKVIEKANSIGLELTQFVHPNLQVVEEIIQQATKDAGIKKDIKKNIKTVNLNALTEFDDSFQENSNLIYERQKRAQFKTNTGLKFRPFLASREEFFKGALLLENDSEYVLLDNLILSTNLKYSLADNFDDLEIPPVDTFPAQVRSDVKEYLKNMDDGLLLGRMQLDYFISPYKNHHLMFTGGILEDMFSGYGFEYLFFKDHTNYSMGLEVFDVKKRDYKWGFDSLEYQNITGHINFNYRNYGLIPFDMKLSYGKYLAGDIGTTIEFSRTFKSGINFGVFASFTDVTSEEFGEGSFDKGLFFNIPIYGNLINYTWRPLTKDPGAKVLRKNNLHGLLVKFRPIN